MGYSTSLLGLALALALSSGAAAESLTERAFVFDGTSISHLADEPDSFNDNNKLYYFANWNPGNLPNNPKMTRPGFQVAFWGKPGDCDDGIHNGPVDSGDFDLFKRAADLTGLPLDTSSPRTKWTPSDAHPQCRHGAAVRRGNSFVHVNQRKGGGVGMFTATGLMPAAGATSPLRPFLIARDESGQDSLGVDKHNVGTFAAFRFDWKDANALRPWGGRQGASQSRVEIRTIQTVAQLSTGGDAKPARDNVQVKQELSFGFINPPCMEEDRPKGSCQLKILLNFAIKRAGVTDWSRQPWFQDGKVLIDKAQGGMPVVLGPVPGKNDTVVTKDRAKLPLWSGHGNATKFSPFNDAEFMVSMSFEQFKNSLRFIASKKLDKPLSSVTGQDVAAQFGKQWDNPAAWRLFWAGFGQEAHNPVADRTAYIGGALKYLSVTAQGE